MEKLGRNRGGYCGETIDIRAVLRDVEQAGREHGWSLDVFHQTEEFKWIALRRLASAESSSLPARAYLSAGIHGDEPAGPLAALRLLEEDSWPPDVELWLCPCLNPTGFALNRRENGQGVDLNRQYRHPAAEETRAHVGWLERQPRFDLCLCLHEDWESAGFYLYELNLNGRPSLAEGIVAKVAGHCPIDPSETIEGRPARNGIIRPEVDPRSRPDWPEAFYLVTHQARLSYTLEAPSDFPLPLRVGALADAVSAALSGFAAGGAGEPAVRPQRFPAVSSSPRRASSGSGL